MNRGTFSHPSFYRLFFHQTDIPTNCLWNQIIYLIISQSFLKFSSRNFWIRKNNKIFQVKTNFPQRFCWWLFYQLSPGKACQWVKTLGYDNLLKCTFIYNCVYIWLTPKQFPREKHVNDSNLYTLNFFFVFRCKPISLWLNFKTVQSSVYFNLYLVYVFNPSLFCFSCTSPPQSHCPAFENFFLFFSHSAFSYVASVFNPVYEW